MPIVATEPEQGYREIPYIGGPMDGETLLVPLIGSAPTKIPYWPHHDVGNGLEAYYFFDAEREVYCYDHTDTRDWEG